MLNRTQVKHAKNILSAPLLRMLSVSLCALLGVVMMAQSQAQAQDQPLLIVPFDQEGVDQVFYEKLMVQVSEDATKSQSFEALDVPVSGKIEDVLFEIGCPELTNECLQLLGETYGAEAIMWGKIWKNDRVTLLEIKLFDVLAGGYTIDPPIERSFETDDATRLRDSIVGEFQQIFFPYTGEITVTASEPSAEVFFDGEQVGNTSTGPVVLTGRPLGEHIVTVRVDDKEVSETVVLLFDKPGTIEVDMAKSATGNEGFRYVGTTVSASAGGLFLVSGVIFSFLTNSAEQDAIAEREKLERGDGSFNSTNANSLQTNGPNYQNLQFISYGLSAAAFLTAGAFYFFESKGDADAGNAEQGTATWWGPMMLPGGAGAAFGGRF